MKMIHTIEDIIEYIAVNVSYSSWHSIKKYSKYSQLFFDLDSHIRRGHSLSEKQASYVIKAITDILPYLQNSDDVKKVLNNPKYRAPLYKSIEIKKEVRYYGKNILVFRFPYNQNIINKFKSFGGVYNRDYKVWLVKVNFQNFIDITTLINTPNLFSADEQVKDFLIKCSNKKNLILKEDTLTVTIYDSLTRDLEVFDKFSNILMKAEKNVFNK